MLCLASCLFSMFLAVSVHAQITIEIKDMPLTEALKKLEEQSGYSFFYSSVLPDKDAIVSVSATDRSINYVMDALLKGLRISYEIKGDNQITLYEKSAASNVQSGKSGSRTISGKVHEVDGYPVIGAGVLIAGSTQGTVTDEDGYWTLELDNENVNIEISSMGYTSQTLDVAGRSDFNVVLRPDTQFLEEVVVVGYGTQKKVNLTGSVAMVGAEDIAARPISSLSSGLQGLLPGVTVVNATGQPGESNTTIRVRGIGTIGNANPLVLIDGVEGDISAVNPEDIESVSVLKDAASASIYGARAANGVLIVTTKKTQGGQQIKPR